MKQYDVIVIGAGQSGPAVAASVQYKGKKVALIEADRLGGTCLNYGCRPTKTLRASARVAHVARNAGEFGIKTGEVEVDFDAVMARKHSIIGGMQQGLDAAFEKMENLDLYYEFGRFTGSADGLHHVQAGDHALAAPLVFINTGTHIFIPPIDGIDSVPYLTSKEMLSLEELPEKLIVLGGGYIGLELGQMYRRFGSEVTIVQGASHLINREDEDVSTAIEALLRGEGIEVLTSQYAQSVSRDEDGTIHLVVEDQNDKSLKTISGTHLLMSVGRRPNSNIGLDTVGVEVNKRGFIVTNGKMETNVEGIWAMGDVNGRGAFTHTSYQEFEVVWENLMKGGDRNVDDRTLAYALFTDPPYGHVGMHEKEARASGRNILMSTYQMKDVSRAKLESETIGMWKILVDADTEEIVGASVLGMQADDVIAIFSNFMATGASYKIMQWALPVHPTIGEFIPTILKGLKPLK